jgi:transcriptional regulator with XRE-family HTH domain
MEYISFVRRAKSMRVWSQQRAVLARLLAMARTACGLTLNGVAEGAKVSAKTIGRYESCAGSYMKIGPVVSLVKFYEAMGVQFDPDRESVSRPGSVTDPGPDLGSVPTGHLLAEIGRRVD